MPLLYFLILFNIKISLGLLTPSRSSLSLVNYPGNLSQSTTRIFYSSGLILLLKMVKKTKSKKRLDKFYYLAR